MQSQPCLHAGTQLHRDATVHEIAEHAAEDAIGIVAGQQRVREMIHAEQP